MFCLTATVLIKMSLYNHNRHMSCLTASLYKGYSPLDVRYVSHRARNPKVHHSVHDNRPPVSVLNSIKPVHNLPIPRSILILSSPSLRPHQKRLLPLSFRINYTSLTSTIQSIYSNHLRPDFIILLIANSSAICDDLLYVIVTILLLRPPSYVQVFSSAPYSLTPPVYVHSTLCETMFYAHT